MRTSLNSPACALLLAALLLLSGCATVPGQQPPDRAPPPQPPADLMVPAKPEGWFHRRLLEILQEAGILVPS